MGVAAIAKTGFYRAGAMTAYERQLIFESPALIQAVAQLCIVSYNGVFVGGGPMPQSGYDLQISKEQPHFGLEKYGGQKETCRKTASFLSTTLVRPRQL